MKFPRMDFYPMDFLEDERVRPLTTSQRGAYALVLFAMWRWAEKHDTVDFPDDDWVIAGAVDIPLGEWQKLRARLIDHPFAPLRKDEQAGVIYSPRLRKEYGLALARHDQARVNGKRGGRPKNPAKANANLPVTAYLPMGNPSVSNSQAQSSMISDQASETMQPPQPDVDKAPAHADDDRDQEAAEAYVLALLHRDTLTPRDHDYLLQALDMVAFDVPQFCRLVDQAVRSFKPSHQGDRIRSFHYCLPVFEAWVARRQPHLRKEPIDYVTARNRYPRRSDAENTLSHLVQPAD